jgi:hypothetical protein
VAGTRAQRGLQAQSLGRALLPGRLAKRRTEQQGTSQRLQLGFGLWRLNVLQPTSRQRERPLVQEADSVAADSMPQTRPSPLAVERSCLCSLSSATGGHECPNLVEHGVLLREEEVVVFLVEEGEADVVTEAF